MKMLNGVVEILIITSIVIIFTIFISIISATASFKVFCDMLEYERIHEIKDGKDDVRVQLFLGPFSYTIHIKERLADKVEASKNEE